jgi:acyl carrier protein
MVDKIKEIMASVFKCEKSDIDENSSPDTIEKWDSLGHMNLVVALEEEFGVVFSEDETVEMLNFKLVEETLKGKNIN